ncbi:unnamed protein product, partial [Mesorhabditis spiculigera]
MPSEKKGSYLTLKRMRNSSQTPGEPLPDYPSAKCPEGCPPPVRGTVTLKERNKRWRRTRRFYAELARGHLKLWKNKKEKEDKDAGLTSAWSTKIDIGAVTVVPEKKQQRFALQFPKNTQILAPVDASTYDVWLEGLRHHRLYKQAGGGGAAEGTSGATSPPQDASGELDENDNPVAAHSPDDGSAPANEEKKMCEGLEATAKVMDDAKELFAMSLEVASSLVGTAEQLNKLQRQMKGTLVEMKREVMAIKAGGRGLQLTPESSMHTARFKSAEELEAFEDAKEKQSAVALEQEKNDLLERSRKVLEETQRVAEPPSDQMSQTSGAVEEAVTAPMQPVVFCAPRPRRTCLPAKMMAAEGLGMGGLARMALSRAGLPVSFFEPLSAIQFLCEELRYNQLLAQAVSARDPVDRMALVAAFAVSGYSNTKGRSRKPLNPILGESFDYVEPTWRFHGEQVSHHPPITAGFAEGTGWVWWQTMDPVTTTSKLSGTIELTQSLPIRLKLATADGMEQYAIEKVHTTIEKPTDPEKRKLRGDIFKGEVVACRLAGHWDKQLTKVATTGAQSSLFQAADEEFGEYYGFNSFTMTLNEPVTPADSAPPTDSRLRPDQRALENGNPGQAAKLKKKLEEAQRVRGKSHAFTPLWFDNMGDEMTQKSIYMPNMKYWTEKERHFAGVHFPDIFTV